MVEGCILSGTWLRKQTALRGRTERGKVKSYLSVDYILIDTVCVGTKELAFFMLVKLHS